MQVEDWGGKIDAELAKLVVAPASHGTIIENSASA
jgi:hypothetical protein